MNCSAVLKRVPLAVDTLGCHWLNGPCQNRVNFSRLMTASTRLGAAEQSSASLLAEPDSLPNQIEATSTEEATQACDNRPESPQTGSLAHRELIPPPAGTGPARAAPGSPSSTALLLASGLT